MIRFPKLRIPMTETAKANTVGPRRPRTLKPAGEPGPSDDAFAARSAATGRSSRRPRPATGDRAVTGRTRKEPDEIRAAHETRGA
jgi:hypothetical protein